MQERIAALDLTPACGSPDELAATQASRWRRREAPIKASGFGSE